MNGLFRRYLSHSVGSAKARNVSNLSFTRQEYSGGKFSRRDRPWWLPSADNLDFISPEVFADSFDNCVSAIDILEHNGVYMNQKPECEPQLGKCGLYPSSGGQNHARFDQMAILWVVNLSDGSHSLLDIAERPGHDFEEIKTAAGLLLADRHLAGDSLPAGTEDSPG
jgi:aminopeptidase-like protein